MVARKRSAAIGCSSASTAKTGSAPVLDKRDPEFHEVWKLATPRRVANSRNEMTIHVYRATLHGLGFRGQAIESEINLHWPTSPGRAA